MFFSTEKFHFQVPEPSIDFSRPSSTHTNVSMRSSSTPAPSDIMPMKLEPIQHEVEEVVLTPEMTPIPTETTPQGKAFPHVCEQCDISFSISKALEEHVEKHNNHIQKKSIPDSKSIYPCLICNQEFSGLEALEKHVETHTSDNGELVDNSTDICKINLQAKKEELEVDVGNNEKAPTQSFHHCDTCLKQYDNLANFVNHLGNCTKNKDVNSKEKTSNKALTLPLSKKRKISPERNTEGTNAKQKLLETEHQKEAKSTDHEPTLRSSSKVTYKCHLCSIKKPLFNDLLCHIAAQHFRDDMIKLTNSDATQCNLCSKQLKTELDTMKHLASFHKVLAGLIPSKDKLSLNQDSQSTKSKSLLEDKKEKISSKISNTTNELEPGSDSETSSLNCQMCDYKKQ